MNENRNNTTQWLQYLLYVGIAALVNSLIGYIPPLGTLSGWVAIAISVASIYLLFRLRDTNPRYQKAAIFSAVAWVSIRIGVIPLTLVGLVCSTISQYQEYYGHSELIEARDSRLAGKWHSLFWAQFVVSLLLGALVGLVGVVLVLIFGSETELTTTLTTILTSLLSLVLRVLYLVYLNRTIALLETEVVE